MHGWMLSSMARMLCESCKLDHCVFYFSFLNDCIFICRYPNEIKWGKIHCIQNYSLCKLDHCVFYFSFLNDCIFICRYPNEIKWGKIHCIQNYSLFKGIYLLLVQLRSSILKKKKIKMNVYIFDTTVHFEIYVIPVKFV